MKELGLLELLRYALSGGIGMAVLFLAHPALACSVGKVDAPKATLIFGSVLLIGTLIYNVHRAVVFPVFLRCVSLWVNWTFTWRLFLTPLRPSESDLRVDRWRWEHPEAERKRWDEWGAQTHSLYCAAWAILVAQLLGNHVWGPSDAGTSRIFWFLFGVTLIAAVINNYRLLCSITTEMVHTPNPGKSAGQK